MKLNALYIGVADMSRALTFYQSIFRQEPIRVEERFSMFDVGGTYFGLFYAAFDGEDLIFGNNCVPNIEVDDIDAEYRRIGGVAPYVDPDIRRVGAYRYFQFKDLDGNLVELYSIDRPG